MEPHLPGSQSCVFVPSVKQTPPSQSEDPLGLTSRGKQVAVEGNVSLAHGQEICTDIWNDRGHAIKRQPLRHFYLRGLAWRERYQQLDYRNVQN